LRFVEAGLALSSDVSNDKGHVLLLEERITSQFYKYMTNGTAALPEYFANAQVRAIAKFLAFTQHVQYWKTGTLAFLSDYQGKQWTLAMNGRWCLYRKSRCFNWSSDHHTSVRLSVLSFPTRNWDWFRSLGAIFTRGNISYTHMTFGEKHPCDEYCAFFELPTNWEAMKSEALVNNDWAPPILSHCLSYDYAQYANNMIMIMIPKNTTTFPMPSFVDTESCFAARHLSHWGHSYSILCLAPFALAFMNHSPTAFPHARLVFASLDKIFGNVTGTLFDRQQLTPALEVSK
jgi:hypothetical protein